MNISVIVVSQNRPVWLARCLRAIRQMDHPSFEVVVVADSGSLAAISSTDLKTVAYDKANISTARNIGISHAAGDLCAFIDDDSVPEPMWLAHIQRAFAETRADAVVGYVRGRNGISFQSRVAFVDNEAETHEQPDAGQVAYVPILTEGQALKLVGTNMAIRRTALETLKGFDEAFAYYLDDTDISLRLAKCGMVAAVAPTAEVHHGFAPSPRRTNLRRPRDLFDIGRSSAIFYRRHQTQDVPYLFDRLLQRESQRLHRHMVNGTCEPREVKLLLKTLKEGWNAGNLMKLPENASDLRQDTVFSPVNSIRSGHTVLVSRLLRRGQTLKMAAELSLNCHRCSVFSFSLTPIRHHVRYTKHGVWVQTGGQFGRSDRADKRLRWCRFANRQKEERLRVALQRGI